MADAYEALFTALAHPARRRIVMTLHFEGGSMTAGAIAAMFQHAWPTTTGHLQVLQAAGLVGQVRDGRSRVYTLNRAQLALARDWLVQLTAEDRHAERQDRRKTPRRKTTGRKTTGGKTIRGASTDTPRTGGRAAAVPSQRRSRRPL